MPNIRPAALAIVVLFAACSKKGSDNGGSGQPSTYLTSFTSSANNGVVVRTDLHYASYGVDEVVILTTDTGVTTYTATLVADDAEDRVSQLFAATDSNANTGTLIAQFVYASSGRLQKIIYNPSSPGLGGSPYDSLVWNGAGEVTADYYFMNYGPDDSLNLYSINQLTWNSQKDVTQALLTYYTTPGGTASNIVTTYTYDGYGNPYNTVKDFALIMQQPSAVGLLTGNNVTSARLTGFSTYDSTLYQYNTSGLPAGASLEILNNGALEGQPLPTTFQYNQ